ncbi:MAG TPA: hypothetical protein VFT21_09930 [Gemmatimonadaceae bacterium]|nr:hypothetical protein [Gemmatimonadaceae bacterium]
MLLTRASFIRRSVLVVSALVLTSGCTDFSSPPDALGKLLVSVKDETGAGIGNVAVDLYLNDRVTQWAGLITSADGTGEFRAKDGGLIPQTYIVRLVLTSNYALAAGETIDKPVTVVIGQTATVNYKLVKKVVEPPPGS